MPSKDITTVIFDTPSRDNKIWSHHVLRILYSVHYKGLPYSIESIEYPDIISTFAQTALEPKDDPVEPYEIPVLQVRTSSDITQYYMNMAKIIQTLEDAKPEPSLLYASPRSVEFRSRFAPAFAPIIQLVVGHVPKVLSERSATFFCQKRKARWGKSVEQWIAEHPIKDGLAAAEPGIKELGDWLELTAGPFVNGDQPGYADFTIASILGFMRAVGLTDAFEMVLAMHKAVKRLYDGVKLTQLGNIHCQSLFDSSE
jgi:glutathione S-transferase